MESILAEIAEIAEIAEAVQALFGDAVDDWEFADLVDVALAARGV